MEKNSSSSISFSGMLTVLFIGLKLTNVIAWSWLWVLSPLWISIGVSLLVILIVLLIALIKDSL